MGVPWCGGAFHGEGKNLQKVVCVSLPDSRASERLVLALFFCAHPCVSRQSAISRWLMMALEVQRSTLLYHSSWVLLLYLCSYCCCRDNGVRAV